MGLQSRSDTQYKYSSLQTQHSLNTHNNHKMKSRAALRFNRLHPDSLKDFQNILLNEDDNMWPAPDRVGRQELEIVIGDEHISFTTSKIGSLVDVNQSKDPEGLR